VLEEEPPRVYLSTLTTNGGRRSPSLYSKEAVVLQLLCKQPLNSRLHKSSQLSFLPRSASHIAASKQRSYYFADYFSTNDFFHNFSVSVDSDGLFHLRTQRDKDCPSMSNPPAHIYSYSNSEIERGSSIFLIIVYTVFSKSNSLCNVIFIHFWGSFVSVLFLY